MASIVPEPGCCEDSIGLEQVGVDQVELAADNDAVQSSQKPKIQQPTVAKELSRHSLPGEPIAKPLRNLVTISGMHTEEVHFVPSGAKGWEESQQNVLAPGDPCHHL